MYCKFCGAELQEGAKFCGACGKKQGNVPENRTGSSGRAIGMMFVLVCSAILTVFPWVKIAWKNSDFTGYSLLGMSDLKDQLSYVSWLVDGLSSLETLAEYALPMAVICLVLQGITLTLLWKDEKRGCRFGCLASAAMVLFACYFAFSVALVMERADYVQVGAAVVPYLVAGVVAFLICITGVSDSQTQNLEPDEAA